MTFYYFKERPSVEFLRFWGKNFCGWQVLQIKPFILAWIIHSKIKMFLILTAFKTWAKNVLKFDIISKYVENQIFCGNFSEKTFAIADRLRTFCRRNFCGFGQKMQNFLPQTLSSLIK